MSVCGKIAFSNSLVRLLPLSFIQFFLNSSELFWLSVLVWRSLSLTSGLWTVFLKVFTAGSLLQPVKDVCFIRGRSCGLVVTFCAVHEWLRRASEAGLSWISHPKEWPGVTLLTTPLVFMNEHFWPYGGECDEEWQKQDASSWLITLMNHSSLQMAHSSPAVVDQRDF